MQPLPFPALRKTYLASAEDRDPHASENPVDQNAAEFPLGRRVLIVEDNFFVSVDFEQALLAAGYELLGICVSADEAFEACNLAIPDFVLMDVRLLGKADGVDAALEIYRHFGVRSVFVTANDDVGTRARARPANPLGWVAKPISGSNLVHWLAAVPKARN